MKAHIFFRLIRVAIGTAQDVDYTPTAEDWQQLYQLAERQALIGIAFAGVQALKRENLERVKLLPQALRMKWLASAVAIHKRNELMNRRCAELQCILTARGVRSSIFKGQANLPYYTRVSGAELAMLRQPGDIDVWVSGGKQMVLRLVQQLAPTREVRETHAHLELFDDVEVEAHYRPGLIRNFLTNARLQRFFARQEAACMEHITGIPEEADNCRVVTPVWTFDAVHQLTHIFHHFFTEGVGLRQCLDYCYLLRNCPAGTREKEDLRHAVSSLHMSRFAGALMWVLAEVFGLPEDRMPWKPNEKDGAFLLQEIMQGGNFGRYDARYNLKRMNPAESLFRITRRNLSLLRFAPFDWFWSPLWRIWHFMKRKCHGYA